ncbi:MAG: GDP-mannose 4,6-dehydratase [Phycisphaeraceae bacterium]
MAADTVLVTGAAGFIGSHLAQALLAQGRRVVGMDNFCSFYDPAIKRRNVAELAQSPGFEFVEADIRDRKAVFGAMAVHRPGAAVHLAAMAGVRPSIENPDLYAAVNLSGTVNLLDAAVEHGARRFVFASSSSVYGNNRKVPFAEADPVDEPISPYAATKKAGELLTHTYWHVHRLPVVCLRFFTVFGPRQRPDLAIAKFLQRVSDGRPIPVFGDGSTSRDYTYVGDIVSGVVAALDHCSDHMPGEGGPTGHRVYNLGGSTPVTLSEMIATIERVVGRRAKIDPRPAQPGDVNRTVADLARARQELGYEPTTRLEEGIARQWAWLREQGRPIRPAPAAALSPARLNGGSSG